MPRRLVFLYRYFTTPYRLRKWLNVQTLLVTFVSMVFLAILIWTAPLSSFGRHGQAGLVRATPTVDPAGGPTVTPLPLEFLTNSQQTIGITLVGALLVLIVVIAVLVFLPQMDEDGKA